MADAVRAVQTNGGTSVNVTPYDLMSEAYWAALSDVWTQLPPTSPSAESSAASR